MEREICRGQGVNIYIGPSQNVCITNLEGPCCLIKAPAIDLRFVTFSLLALGHAGLSRKSHFRRGRFWISHQLTLGTCIPSVVVSGGRIVHKSIW